MLLQKGERMHAAHGMRCISPFVDPEVIQSAFEVPSRYKNNGRRNKIVFRDAMRPLLPAHFRDRPKYAQRMRENSAFCDALATAAKPLLDQERVRSRGFFDPDYVSRLLRGGRTGTWPPEHAMQVWTMVLSELWAQIFLDGAGVPPEASADLSGQDKGAVELL
jgi:asparagine synthase (glutamine-hydrolysing)